ncbi:alpha/beta hydrolase [Salinibacterium sp. dk2585]|uniref:alpha/beta fold hydrolase n=1 Tax=unclassified Salinibacterium TaxID=2632331 RepID=UPI0011C253F1|nr:MULTISPECIES: alpha/beta hydrolase [unclassified Salinibacterium]QEE60302.1 alpha/beta hydrolase [Salinibacterium sp. dk2585]TXK55374.1 alpha/beta hydrolase [Salinibacterium sp. dk5596]
MSEKVRVGELEFDVRVAGPEDGIPVVLLHGFPETSRSWTAVADQLVADGMRVIAPDQRGYSPGARPVGAHEYDIKKLVADVLGLMDALGLDSAHLAGHDWGASVAWAVSAWHPERVRSLVAVSVPHPAALTWAIDNDPDQQRRSAYITLFRDPGKAEKTLLKLNAAAFRALFGTHIARESVDEYLAHLSEPGALLAALNWYRAMTREFGEIPAVTVPTTYLWSTSDPALGEAAARRCEQFVSGDYRLIVLEGVSHWVPEEAPAEVVAAIRSRVAEAPPNTLLG